MLNTSFAHKRYDDTNVTRIYRAVETW